MLDAVRFEKMREALDALPFHVVLPAEWKDYFTRRGPLPSQKDENRRYVRSYFRMHARMDLTQTLPLVPRACEQHVVLMKDVSRQGAGFLHSSQLFPGERVRLWLPTGCREYSVVRCARHNDSCYEIGAELSGNE